MAPIWHISFEGLPFSKVGGLADVVYGLSAELAKKLKIRVCLPYHLAKVNKLYYAFSFSFLNKNEEVEIYREEVAGVEYLLFKNNTYLTRERIYEEDDDDKRYAFFCLAIYYFMLKSGEKPLIMHEHDYHSTPLIALCKLKDNSLKSIKHLFTIHNFFYQGAYGKEYCDLLTLPLEAYNSGLLKYGEGVNLLKWGLVLADKVVTVSPTYLKELVMSEEDGMHKLLKEEKEKCYGILNGINYEYFNPLTLNNAYDYQSLAVKKEHKLFLQKHFGLNEDKDIFLCGIVSRLTEQKGLELIINSPFFKEGYCQLIVCGKGQEKYQVAIKELARKYPKYIAFGNFVSEEVAKEIYAGSDLILVPSVWEPCGLTQMIAMRYGSLPLVRKVGGLSDSVIAYPLQDGDGFVFINYEQEEFNNALKQAIDLYYKEPLYYQKMQQKAMLKDNSFFKAARQYAKLYLGLFNA